MKKLFKGLLVTILAVLSLSVFSSWQTVGAQGQVINLSINTEPPTIDPGLATDSTSGAIILNVFEGLTAKDAEGNVVPGMAESWDMSDDELTYTFHLRDAQWNNGDPVTAGDFEYAWKRVLNPETASQYASIMYFIEGAEAYNTGEGEADGVGVKAVDDKTLEVKLAHPTPFFTELTAFYTYMPVHQASVDGNDAWAADAGESYVTNGAFSLAQWNHNADYQLVANENYWDAENVAFDEVNVQIIESEATSNAEYQAGSLDYLGSPYGTVSLDYIDQFRSNGELNTNPYAAIYWYKVNTTDEVLQNANIRKALALAINRQELIDNVTKGEQTAALGIIPPTMEGFEEDRGYMSDFDVEGAKAALQAGMDELGIKDPSEITVALSINDSEAHSAIAQFIQANWTDNLGINVSIDSTEWQVYLDKLNQLDYQVGRMGWIADYNDPITFLDMYRTAETGNNDTGWENEDYKNLIDQANQETDEATRTQYLLDAEAILMEEMPVIPVYYYTSNFVKNDRVQGMQPDPLGNINLKYVSMAE
ncbi:ABC transporter substrate-binding protein [Suicoccus acidiformans]|uniref:ABC transporter substrate-binding protein n=1 Tax=Suicoccus acidiformans TaxID=2036206 RepID=A0A347WIE2_9LACT|nr:peptide ABC transporter substrate-binding protein [Suicoccus acidiformans]AXY24849.1 ABC transporter substrate-binding protein [Suicoccus acidiformans]